jgi:hypothetical protein
MKDSPVPKPTWLRFVGTADKASTGSGSGV